MKDLLIVLLMALMMVGCMFIDMVPSFIMLFSIVLVFTITLTLLGCDMDNNESSK